MTLAPMDARSATGDKRIQGAAFIVAVLLFFFVCMAVKWQLEPVRPVADNVSDRFSAERAVNVLAAVLGDESPHPVDSAANDDVRERIVARLGEYGYQADVQKATSCRKLRVYVCAELRNIVALHKGAPSGKTILLSAHYDSVGAGPGASDDGSGVAVLLEVARLLQQYPNSKNSILFLFTEGEESGLLGANAFATQNPLARDVALAINVEARGTSGQSALFETGSTSGWAVDAFAGTSRHPLANSLISTIYKLLPNDTDLTIFKSHGIQGLNFAYGEHLAYYHTPRDNLQSLNRGSLQQQGDNVYDLVRALLDQDIPAASQMGSTVYTDILGMGMLRWPASLSLWIAIVSLLVFAWASLRIRKQHPYMKADIFRGLLIVPLSLLLGGVIAFLLMTALTLVNGDMTPWHSNNVSNRVLLWSSVLLVVLLLQRLLRRNSDPLGVCIGVGYAWLVSGMVSAALLPGISYLFIIPSLALVIASLLALMASNMQRQLLMLSLLPALPAFMVIMQAVFLVEIMMGFNEEPGTVGMGMFIGLASTFIAPLLPLNPPSKILRYGGMAILLVIAIGAFISIRAFAYSDEQPQALNISYLQRANGDAYLVSSSDHPPPAVLQAMTPKASLKEIYPEFKDSDFAESIASAKLPAADLAVLSDKQVGTQHDLVLRIDADNKTQRIAIFFPKAMGLRSIETDGQSLDYAGSHSNYGNYNAFICRGSHCNGRQLSLIFENRIAQPVIIEKSSPLAGVGENVVAARNINAIPQQDGDQSIVMKEISL